MGRGGWVAHVDAYLGDPVEALQRPAHVTREGCIVSRREQKSKSNLARRRRRDVADLLSREQISPAPRIANVRKGLGDSLLQRRH